MEPRHGAVDVPRDGLDRESAGDLPARHAAHAIGDDENISHRPAHPQLVATIGQTRLLDHHALGELGDEELVLIQPPLFAAIGLAETVECNSHGRASPGELEGEGANRGPEADYARTPS